MLFDLFHDSFPFLSASVNFQFNFYVLKRPYYSTVDWKNLLKNIIFFTKY